MHKRMNWSAIDFDWNQVRAFLATIEEGSLSAAARALGQTQPTLGRQVAALEEDLKVTLFERSGRQLLPTPVALEMAEHVRAMCDAAMRLSLIANGQSQSVEGVVKITASEMFSAFVLPRLVTELAESHPGLIIEIIATNSLSDLRRREADIAIRNAEPTDPDLIARKIGMESAGLFATREFIEKYGPFVSVDDIARAPFIGFGTSGDLLEALNKRGVPVTKANIIAASDNHLVHWELARQGLGIGLNGREVGAQTPELLPLLPDVLTFKFPVWLVAPSELRTSRRVRIVYDALVRHLLPSEKTMSKSA